MSDEIETKKPWQVKIWEILLLVLLWTTVFTIFICFLNGVADMATSGYFFTKPHHICPPIPPPKTGMTFRLYTCPLPGGGFNTNIYTDYHQMQQSIVNSGTYLILPIE